MVLCAGCDSPILDRFLSKVEERSWHARCVKCWDCQGVLADKCFARDGKLFCRNDFFRRFGPKCGVCSGALRPTDLVRRARGRVYHVACFTCLLCRRQPDTGEQLYVLDEARFVCRDDYNKHQHTSSSTPPLDSPEPDASPTDSAVASPQGGDSNSEPGVYHDSPQGTSEDLGTEGPGGAKRRGPRTTIKAKQLETLKAAFAATPKPTRHIREQLAQETGLNMRVIQVWFQNRRSKERRMKQLSSLGARRHFFRGPRRALRPLRDEPIPNHTFPYFSDSNSPHDFNYPPHPGFYDYFPHGMPDYPGTVPIPPSDPPHSNGVANLGADAPFMSTPSDCLGTNSSPDNPLPDTNSYQSTFPSFMHETRVW